jgi:hypothetical protein
MKDPNAEGRSIKGPALVLAGFVLGLAGFVLAPDLYHISESYLQDLYFPLFFLLIGAGLVVLGVKRFTD